jgi:hypothetical protein
MASITTNGRLSKILPSLLGLARNQSFEPSVETLGYFLSRLAALSLWNNSNAITPMSECV